MKRSLSLLLFSLALTVAHAEAHPSDSTDAAALRAVADAFFQSFNTEDLDGMLQVLHDDSPMRDKAHALSGMWEFVDTRVELLSMRVLSVDEPFAFTREQRRITMSGAPDGEQRQATAMGDFVVAYRRGADGWRYWNTLELESTQDPTEEATQN